MSGTGELNMRQGEILTILRQVFIHIKSIANFATTYIANTNKVSVHTFLSMCFIVINLSSLHTVHAWVTFLHAKVCLAITNGRDKVNG